MPRFDKNDVLSAMTGRFADFYAQYALLKPNGGEMRGPCPIHHGMSPSFAVSPDTGEWCCHSKCGAGGDVFRFLEMLDGIAFTEAMERVAAFAGVSEQSSRPAALRPTPVPPAAAPDTFLDVCIVESLHERLMKSDSMRLWLSESRGLTTETLTRFQIGMQKDEQGLYRVTFPVYDTEGRLLNIRRHLFAYKDGLDRTYKTLPWEKGLRAGLFPLSALNGAKEALIVEGEADAALACQIGFAAVTGTLGAGNWKPEWSESLRGLACVTVLYDDDEAGQAGAQKAAASIARVVPDVRIARYSAALSGGQP